jgi:glycosyltransferase involved in cell wall biosynthesis
MTAPRPIRRVLIVRRVTSDYQVPFYQALHKQLAAASISLEVCSGAPWPQEALPDSLDALPFGHRVTHRRLAGKAFWSPGLWSYLQPADLLLMEQANAQLINPPLLLGRTIRRLTGRKGPLVALIGHGGHFNRTRPAPIRDALRRFLLNRADWFFAYTNRSSRRVQDQGFPSERITVFDNTLDTAPLMKAAEALTPRDQADLRLALFGDAADRPTALFCGRLVKEKEIPFLLNSLAAIREAVPEFRAILIGDGPERERVDAFRRGRAWCAWVGKKTGTDRVPYFKIAHLALHPAPAGLALIDSFALGLPFITIEGDRHGPEIDYLVPGTNGLLTPADPASFARAVVDTLRNPGRLARLRQGALESGRLHTLGHMTDRFTQGILACLNGRPPT